MRASRGPRPGVPLRCGDDGVRPLPLGVIGDGPRATSRRLHMATIATLTQKADGNLEGTLATLNVTAPIALVPNTRKAKDNEPDYRVISRKNGFEL
ncbi:DUF736 family protein, partial [Xanthobacter autotrophicus]|uniref:DUF736 family protein n=1 Tax=Xanthobacter autotrophicus TaxID=280 RepID=UPI003735F769